MTGILYVRSMGYDIGNVIANMIFAWCNGDAAGAGEFCSWVESVLRM